MTADRGSGAGGRGPGGFAGPSRREFLTGAVATAALARAGTAQGPAAKRGKIDIHVHLGRDRDEMRQVTKDKIPGAVKHLIAEMDKHGVAKALIVPVEPLFPTDIYLEAAKLEPERLLAACSVVPRPANQAIDKLRAYREQGARALKLQPQQYDPQDPAVERLVAEAVQRNLPVLFHHTDTPKGFPDMLSHLASTFPNGNFVVIHFGGVYGFWDVLPLARLPNVYLETSTAFARIVKSPLRSMLHFLAEENRLDKIIFGSELPGDYGTVFSAIDALLGPGAKEEVRKAVYRGNAEKILRLTASSRLQREEEDRERREKVTETFGVLGLKEGVRVADIGAGDGFYTVRLSRAVGKTGRVLAVDVSEREVKRLTTRLKEDEIDNVEVIHGDAKDPKLAAETVDAALIVDAYHEMKEHQAMLAGIRRALKPGGRLVILDHNRRGDSEKDDKKRTREQQVNNHEIEMELVEQELGQAGFEIAERRPRFVESGRGSSVMWLIVARRGGER